MIYWTPLDIERVFDGWDEMRNNLVETNYDGMLLQVEPLEHGTARVVRLISGNPMDYLRPDVAPGSLIRY